MTNLREIEEYFKRLGQEFGPKTLEVIDDQWMDVAYRITHTDGKYSPWHLRFSGIELPKYDQYVDGMHNNAVRMLFTHLLARVIDWQKGSPPGDFSGEDGRNPENTAQIPGCQVESLEHGKEIARNTIEAYLGYKDNINAAIGDIEAIYRIDPITRTSEELGIGSRTRIHEYPSYRALIPIFKEKYNLDYLSEKIF